MVSDDFIVNQLNTCNNQTFENPPILSCKGNRIFGPPPPWFEQKLLPRLTEHQIAWWDECHIEQQGGKVGNRAFQYSFKRDENGKLSKKGTYQEPELTKTTFKFPEQARFSFGVATVCASGGTKLVGKRCPMFNYTGQNIVTREVFGKHMKEECDRVKKLKGKCLPWFEDTRPKGEVWMQDSIVLMKGVGGKKGNQLMDIGIKTVQDIKQKTDEDLLALSSTLLGISFLWLWQLRDTPAHPGSCPHIVIDHKKNDNPYFSKYGGNWEEEIRKTVFLKQYCCITDLVEHIHKCSKEAFVGTTHEDTWYFYHDALKQLTAKSTVEWMKEKGYYRRWLLPQLGLNGNTPYANRPVGNRPEWMPLDNSLNNDIQSSLSLHCAITSHLDDNDPRKFSFLTPSKIVSGIERIYGSNGGNVPSSERIIHDCRKALSAFSAVYEHGGKMVPGLANRNGHRNFAEGRNTAGWGGLRIKNLLVEESGRWLHEDAVSVKNSRTAEILAHATREQYESSDDECTIDECH